MEAALLQATVPAGDDEGLKGDSMVFPSYSLTDVDGVLHTCTVRPGYLGDCIHDVLSSCILLLCRSIAYREHL